MQVEKCFSKKDLSNERRLFLPSLNIRSCRIRQKSGKKWSTQHGNAAMNLLLSSLFKAVSTFVMFLKMEGWLSQKWDCLRWSAATWNVSLVGVWWCRTLLVRWVSLGAGLLYVLEVFCQGICRIPCSSMWEKSWSISRSIDELLRGVGIMIWSRWTS